MIVASPLRIGPRPLLALMCAAHLLVAADRVEAKPKVIVLR